MLETACTRALLRLQCTDAPGRGICRQPLSCGLLVLLACLFCGNNGQAQKISDDGRAMQGESLREVNPSPLLWADAHEHDDLEHSDDPDNEEIQDPIPPSVISSVEPALARVGEPVQFTIKVSHDGTKLFRLPPGLNLGEMELLSREHQTLTHHDNDKMDGQPPQAKQDPNTVVEVFLFRLAAFEPGEWIIPDLEIPYLDQTGRQFFLTAGGGNVRIKSVLANEASPSLRKPPEVQPADVEVWWPIYGAMGLVGLILFSAFAYYFGKKSGRRRIPAEAPRRPAHETALEKLDRLGAENLLDRGLTKEFYLRLSEIIREYLGARYGFYSLEMTSYELMKQITSIDTTPLDSLTVESFLDGTDLVKFARYQPGSEETSNVWALAYRIVKSTIPKPQWNAEDNPSAAVVKQPEPDEGANNV